MRDLLRLIAVGVMSFAIVGLAMLYSRGSDVSSAFRVISDGVSSTVAGIGDQLTGTAPEAPSTESYTLNIARPHPARWMGIAGFPDSTEIAFPVPRNGSYQSGVMDLVFDAQLTDKGDGLMTLSVNGTPRGQLVVNSGHHTHHVRMELTAADLSGERLVLGMAGRGVTNTGQICPTDAANSGSAITLTAESRLELMSEEAPADTLGVLLASRGTLAIQPGENSGDAALAIWATQQLTRAGIDARLSSGGTGETPVTVTSHSVAIAGTPQNNVLIGERAVRALIDAAGLPQELEGAGAVNVAQLGADTLVKTFRGSRRWTIPFAAADMPKGGLPEIFSLQLKTTPLAGGNDWVVRISLNGNLVETKRVAGNTDTLSYSIALPAERMLPQNTLVVEVVDTTPNEGICTRAPDAQAQLLPESQLIDTMPASIDWAALIEGLAAAPSISFKADELTAAQAERAAQMLSLILPRTAELRFDTDADVQIQALPQRLLPGVLAMAGSDPVAVLPVATNAGTSLMVRSAGDELAAALKRLDQDDVVFLISR